MKKIFFVIFTLLASVIAIGQKNLKDTIPPKVQSKKQIESDRKNQECIQRNHSNFSKRIKNYPFNNVSQVKIVSFLNPKDTNNESREIKTAKLPMMNDTVCYSKLYEIKTLNIVEVDTLTNILYNVGFRGPVLRESEMGCYEPRNAILFIDKNGQTFEYIEICFECEQNTVSSNKIILGDFCNQKYDLIKKFFLNAGILYGTN